MLISEGNKSGARLNTRKGINMAQSIFEVVSQYNDNTVVRFQGQIALIKVEETEVSIHPATSESVVALGKYGDIGEVKGDGWTRLIECGRGLWAEVTFSPRPSVKIALDLAPAPKERKGKGETEETPETA